jgi:hypothetical protein
MQVPIVVAQLAREAGPTKIRARQLVSERAELRPACNCIAARFELPSGDMGCLGWLKT